MPPALGRMFDATDHKPGRDRIVILSEAFWRRNFGADPNLIDRTIIVNAAPHTVIGVLPPGVNFDYFTAEPIELYMPYPMTPDIHVAHRIVLRSVRRVMAFAGCAIPPRSNRPMPSFAPSASG